MKSYNQYRGDLVERYQKEWDSIDEETRNEILEVIKHEEGETLDEWVGKVAKAVGRLPGIRTAVGLGMAGYRASKGDWTGAGLSLGSAIPGPVGWGFVGADIARDVAKGGGPKGAVQRRTGSIGNTGTPGQTGNTGTTGRTGTPTKKEPAVKLKFNMPKNFDTNKTYGKSTTDAWSPNYKPQSKTDRTRSQVRSDDAKAVSDYASRVQRRLSTSRQSSHRGVR